MGWIEMVECPVAGIEWENKEGYFTVQHAPEGHPWIGKVVCIDWDYFCTKCRDEEKSGE